EPVANQLQPCAIGVAEVERATDLLIGHPSGIEFGLDALPLCRLHGQCQVMEAPEYLLVRAQVQPWKIEESNGVAMANIKEEVRRALVIAVLKDIGQGKFQQSLVELYGPLHVGAEQCHMVYAARRRWRTISLSPHIGGAQPSAFGGEGGEIEFRHTMLLAHGL